MCSVHLHGMLPCRDSTFVDFAALELQPLKAVVFIVQATKPFIDPVTHKKIVFVDAHDTTSMPEHFHMESLEQCMGGSLSLEQVFNLNHYRAEMMSEDAQQQQAYEAVQYE